MTIEATKGASAAQIELVAIAMTDRLRNHASDVASRLKMVCPEHSCIRTASEFRAIARSLALASQHILANADAMEADHGR